MRPSLGHILTFPDPPLTKTNNNHQHNTQVTAKYHCYTFPTIWFLIGRIIWSKNVKLSFTKKSVHISILVQTAVLLQIIFHTPKLPSTVLQPVPETHRKTTCSFACEMIPLKVRGSDWLVWSFGQTGQVGWKIRDFRSQLFLPKHLCLPQNG